MVAKISVIIPTYNRAISVCSAVKTVLQQTYSDFEVIVVDDGSTDSTVDKLSMLRDERLKIYRIEQSGVSFARNYGFSQSVGGMIAFLDSDDLWHQDKLYKQIEFHKKNPELRISQTQEIWIRNGKRVNPKFKHQKPEGFIFEESLHLCTISPSSVIMHRQLFEETGGFDINLKACEDYDLWLRITPINKVGLIDELLLTKFGGHEDQLSQKHPAMDRFRIYSMGKCLLSNKLNTDQREELLKVLKGKTTILLDGLAKRGKDFGRVNSLLEDLINQSISMNRFISESQNLLLSEDLFQ